MSDVASQTGRAFIGIRELLLRGVVVDGERLSELPLVARLGMSRTPIRLALERLAHLGFIDASSGSGFTVRAFTPGEALDAIELRGVLEGTAARLAAERLALATELDDVRQQLRKMEELQRLTLDSFGLYMDFNHAFHSGITALSKSVMLRRHLEQVGSLPFASPSAMVFPTCVLPQSDETFAVAIEHHRDLVEAIRKRQGKRAERIAREHASLARGVLAIALSDSEALSRIPGARLIHMPTTDSAWRLNTDGF